MTERKLLTLDDFVKQPTTYTRFGEKVTRNPIEQVYNAGLLKDYKQLAVSHKYIRFTGMQEEADGGEGWYIRDDNITDDEDIGVIIYIGQYKYRRLYGAYVLVDWFYTGDFGIALQRACKYASVRCIAGKVYECNSAITLKLNVRGGVNNNVDYGHILVDLRGATINYTAENTSFCFNVRIYNRGTKFMFINGTFNVSDLAKITLKNIANIIGGNNYTDMLTDMHYNVDKELLPDTNRVVLFSEPVIEGIKTFSNTLIYTGDATNAAETDAVTKDYAVDIDEDKYISVSESRKISGITTFTDIYDILAGNTTILDNDYSKLLEDVFYNYVANTIVALYPTFSSYVHLSTITVAGGWAEYLQQTTEDYKVSSSGASMVITAQPQCIIDENDIGIPVYLRLQFSKPIIVENPEIIEEDNIELEDEADMSGYSDAPDNTITFADNVIFARGTSPLDTILGKRVDNKLLYIVVTKFRTYKATQQVRFSNLIVFYSEGIPYCFNTQLTDYGFNVGYRNWNGNSFFSTSFYLEDKYYNFRASGDYKLSYAVVLEHKIKLKIDTGKVYKLANAPFKLATSYVTGAEYISLEQPSFYLDTYTRNENSISFDSIFIKIVTPVQANLVGCTDPALIKPCATLSMGLLYNKELLSVNSIAFYIARFISNGQPAYEIPISISKGYTTTNRYPLYKLYTNNWINPITYKFKLVDMTIDTAIWIDKRVHREKHCDKSGCCSDCRCKCHIIAGHITGNANGDQVTLFSTYGNTFTHNISRIYNTYIYGCSGSEGQIPDCFFATGGKTGFLVSRVFYEGIVGITPSSRQMCYPSIFTNEKTLFEDSIPTLKHGECYYAKQYTASHGNKASYTETSVPCHVGIYSTSSACGKDGVPLSFTYNTFRSTRYYNAIFSGVFKNRLFDRVFGRKCVIAGILYRDGILSDPFRNRHNSLEHAMSMPVCPY